MTLTFRAKLLASHLGLVTAILLLVVLELNPTLGGDLVRQLDERLEQQAQGAAQWVGEGRRHPDKLAGRLAPRRACARSRIFDRDGNVLGDSAQPDVAGAPSGVDGARSSSAARARRDRAGDARRRRRRDALRRGPRGRRDGPAPRRPALGHRRHRRRDATPPLASRRRSPSAPPSALGWLASRLAARPLRAMTESATRIAQGDYAISPVGVARRLRRPLAHARVAGRAARGQARRAHRRSATGSARSSTGMAEGVLVVGAERTVVLANPAAEMHPRPRRSSGKTLDGRGHVDAALRSGHRGGGAAPGTPTRRRWRPGATRHRALRAPARRARRRSRSRCCAT